MIDTLLRDQIAIAAMQAMIMRGDTDNMDILFDRFFGGLFRRGLGEKHRGCEEQSEHVYLLLWNGRMTLRGGDFRFRGE